MSTNCASLQFLKLNLHWVYEVSENPVRVMQCRANSAFTAFELKQNNWKTSNFGMSKNLKSFLRRGITRIVSSAFSRKFEIPNICMFSINSWRKASYPMKWQTSWKYKFDEILRPSNTFLWLTWSVGKIHDIVNFFLSHVRPISVAKHRYNLMRDIKFWLICSVTLQNLPTLLLLK